jgi:DnaJ-class molecular chaperone
MKDLYSILNVTKEANEKEIKKSYKKLAFQYHPDKNKDPEAIPKFKEISEAYEILTKPEKKKIYDQFGYEAVSEQCEGFTSPIDLFQSLFNVDFTSQMRGGNIFMFSDLSSGPFPPGFNLQSKMTYPLNMTLNELYNGTKKEFTINHRDRNGSLKNTNYVINIKKGSKHGDNIVVKEGGNFIPELNIVEDLVIQVVEQNHDLYKRNGDDLYIEHTISLAEALCGCNLMVDHLSGPINITIDTIIKPNSLFRVKNKGMPVKEDQNKPSLTETSEDNEYGDLILDLTILFPTKLDPKRIDIIRKIFNYKEDPKSETSLVAYHYKDKEDIVKELMNENQNQGHMEEEGGCIQQ